MILSSSPEDCFASDLILENLYHLEAPAFHHQLPLVWKRASGVHVYDEHGNAWLDWTSGVLTANAGHSREEVKAAIINQVNADLLHAYVFPTEIKLEFLRLMHRVSGKEKGLIFTTGSEAIEAAIKLALLRDQKRNVILSFEGGFHGRTMGSQLAGGIERQKTWINVNGTNFLNLPYPGEYDSESSGAYMTRVRELLASVKGRVAGLVFESFQGSTLDVGEPSKVAALAEYCKAHDILVIADEIQSGFGRTGKMFGYELYDLKPDIICLGKALTGSLPLSCLMTDASIASLPEPGLMSSTHTGNPICLAAAIANIHLYDDGSILSGVKSLAPVFAGELRQFKQQFKDVIGYVRNVGLVGGLKITRSGLASTIVNRCLANGLLVFSPLGKEKDLIKISPPLVTTEDQLKEGFRLLTTSIREALAPSA